MIFNRFEDMTEYKMAHDEGFDTEDNVVYSALHRQGTITSKYGERDLNGHKFHHGIDIAAKAGDPVYPVFSGTVSSVRTNLNDLGGRNVFVVSDDGQYRMMVCHLSSVLVKPGDHVDTNTIIGLVGGSGDGQENRYRPHLHLEIHKLVMGKVFRDINPIDSGQTPYIDLGISTDDVPPFVLAEMNATDQPKISELTGTKSERIGTLNDNIYNTAVILMRELQISVAQASGIIGNIMHESQFNPHARHPNGSAEGLCQWLGKRKKNYHERYGKNPASDPNINNQIDFIVYEMRNYEKSALIKLKKCHTPESSALSVMIWYERPNDSTGPSRQKYAREAYNIIRNRCIFKTNTSYSNGTDSKKSRYSTMFF